MTDLQSPAGWPLGLDFLYTYPRHPCIRDVLDPSVLEFSLSLYRHPSIYILFTSHFTSYNKPKKHPMTSSVSLGIPVPRGTHPVYSRRLDPSVLTFCPSLHRHPDHSICILFRSLFISSNQEKKNGPPQSDGLLKNTDRKKILHYRHLYEDQYDRIWSDRIHVCYREHLGSRVRWLSAIVFLPYSSWDSVLVGELPRNLISFDSCVMPPWLILRVLWVWLYWAKSHVRVIR
jgi:hypothetical protein